MEGSSTLLEHNDNHISRTEQRVSRKKSIVLTDHELRLMEVVWKLGRASVADVVSALLPPTLAYNTVLTTLRTLEQKRYLTHDEDGRAYLFRPIVTRKEAAKSAIQYVVDRFFGGSSSDFAVSLIEEAANADCEMIARALRWRKARN